MPASRDGDHISSIDMSMENLRLFKKLICWMKKTHPIDLKPGAVKNKNFPRCNMLNTTQV